MWKLIAFMLVIGVIGIFLKAIAIVVAVVIGIVLLVLAVYILISFITFVYYLFNPDEKKKYLDKKSKDIEDARFKQEQEAAKRESEEYWRVDKRNEDNRRIQKEKDNKELERQQHRDSDQQDIPYTYQIGTHGNESLAIRYGIANQIERKIEYWYPVKGGEKKRDVNRDSIIFEPANKINLKKVCRLGNDMYQVLLTDYRDRPAKAIIETGTEYVKTFYPLKDSWFERHADLELALKGNGTFTLKELATFHIQKTIE